MINFDNIPIDKFDAVCAQKLTRKAIDLMVSEKETKEWVIKVKKKVKEAAERGEYYCVYYFPDDLSHDIIASVIKDLKASWFYTDFHIAHNYEKSIRILSIKWRELNN